MLNRKLFATAEQRVEVNITVLEYSSTNIDVDLICEHEYLKKNFISITDMKCLLEKY